MMKKIRRILGSILLTILCMANFTVKAAEINPAASLNQAVEMMAERGQTPVFDGTQGIAICYAPVLIGENQANALVGNVVVTNDVNGKKLIAAVLLTQPDTLYPGMNTFTAVFYDINGQLIKAIPVFQRDSLPYVATMLEWYIPEGSASVIMY